jgi:uncharacterized protein
VPLLLGGQTAKIILFGSFAYGTPHEWSHVDLLVVMPTYNEISQSIRITLAFDREFPLDLIGLVFAGNHEQGSCSV